LRLLHRCDIQRRTSCDLAGGCVASSAYTHNTDQPVFDLQMPFGPTIADWAYGENIATMTMSCMA
jgi:hypothetical protein